MSLSQIATPDPYGALLLVEMAEVAGIQALHSELDGFRTVVIDAEHDRFPEMYEEFRKRAVAIPKMNLLLIQKLKKEYAEELEDDSKLSAAAERN
jgi:hypothetical protein